MFALPLLSQERSWRIQSFHSDITLARDGSADVNERLTFLFNGHYNGIVRTIPVDYPGGFGGSNYSLDLSVVSVTDDSGSKLKYGAKHRDRFEDIRIYIPGAEDTSKTVVIRYRAGAAAKYFKDFDEFYWNVTGTDWRVPIDSASATVHLPDNAQDLRAQAFTGTYGSRDQDANVGIQPQQVMVTSNNVLSAREGLTLDIALPKGVLQEPSALTRALRLVKGNVVLFLPVWALVVMFAIKRLKGRSADPGMSVAPQYDPPPNMTPAESGTLIDDKIDQRDITSTLVDLAVRGFIKIKEVEKPGFFHSGKDYELRYIQEPADWNALPPYEQIMLNQIFADGPAIFVSDLKERFYVAVPKIKETILAELDRKGMYATDPQQAIGLAFMGAVIIALPFLAAMFLFGVNLFRAPLWAFGSIGLAALIVVIFGTHLASTTLQGSRTKIHILGLREFMNRVDKDRLKRMPPDTFEKLLPYAMALGVEERWAKAFEGIVQNPPSWYEGSGFYGPGFFNPWLFTQSLGSMVQTTGDAFVAAPAPQASGSGFGGNGGGGGGGFSGGGFGGGGGDAF